MSASITALNLMQDVSTVETFSKRLGVKHLRALQVSRLVAVVVVVVVVVIVVVVIVIG